MFPALSCISNFLSLINLHYSAVDLTPNKKFDNYLVWVYE